MKSNSRLMKIIGAFLAVVMLIFCFASCRKDALDKEPKKPKATDSASESKNGNIFISDDNKGLNKIHTIVKGKLTVATSANFPPFEFIENGKISGVDAEIAQAIADKLGFELVFSDMDFDYIISSVQSGRSDIGIAAIEATAYSSEKVDFSESYMNGYAICVSESNPELLKAINTVLRELKADGTIDGILAKHNLSPFELNDEQKHSLGELDNLPNRIDTSSKEVTMRGITSMKLKANQLQQNVILSNPEENDGVCFMSFVIFIDKNENKKADEGDEMIYKSGLVKPGYSVSKFNLLRTLEPGEYNLVILEQPYSMDKTLSPLNNFNVPLTVTVE